MKKIFYEKKYGFTKLYEDELLEKMKKNPIQLSKRCRISELHPKKLFQNR